MKMTEDVARGFLKESKINLKNLAFAGADIVGTGLAAKALSKKLDKKFPKQQITQAEVDSLPEETKRNIRLYNQAVKRYVGSKTQAEKDLNEAKLDQRYAKLFGPYENRHYYKPVIDSQILDYHGEPMK